MTRSNCVLMRDSRVTGAQLRALAALTPAARQAVADLIEHTARNEVRRTSPS